MRVRGKDEEIDSVKRELARAVDPTRWDNGKDKEEDNPFCEYLYFIFVRTKNNYIIYFKTSR